jgi:DNA-binding HxlR family transcriptional regulator
MIMEYKDESAWDENCPAYQLFSLIGKKWTIYVIFLIWENVNNFSFILKKLPKMNWKVLSDRLDDLIESEIITRDVSVTKPLKITYTLTEKWEKVYKNIKETWAWVIEEHYKKLQTS